MHTKEIIEILSNKTNSELDALVSQIIIGNICSCHSNPGTCSVHGAYNRHYFSGELGTAWKLVQKMETMGLNIILTNHMTLGDNFHVEFVRNAEDTSCEGESVTRTICIAALLCFPEDLVVKL